MGVLIRDEISGAEISYNPMIKNWILSVGGRIIALDDKESDARLSMLPFTQKKVQEILDLICSYIEKMHISNGKEIKEKFPWSNFLLVAFRQGSPHWVQNALNWMDELREDMITEVIDDHLRGVVRNKKRYDQKIRQHAYKLLKRRKNHDRQST